MLESIITLGRARPQADALANTETASRFWDALPRGDPLQMQRLICEELAKCASINTMWNPQQDAIWDALDRQ